MLSKIAKNKSQILITILVVMCLGLVRAFENQLFYDPFLKYFDSDFKNVPFPEVDGYKLFFGLFFRYLLNTFFSLILIYALFRDREILKFSSFLYMFFLVLLFVLFFIILNYFPDGNWLLFYVRRFIIQPVFILLFIPAFYYQQLNFKK